MHDGLENKLSIYYAIENTGKGRQPIKVFFQQL
jgi:hypothetical protein